MNDPESSPLKNLDAIEHVAAVLFADILKLHDDGKCGVIEARGAGHADSPLSTHGLENAEWEPVVREDVDNLLVSNVFPSEAYGSQFTIGDSWPIDRLGCLGQFPRRTGFRLSK